MHSIDDMRARDYKCNTITYKIEKYVAYYAGLSIYVNKFSGVF